MKRASSSNEARRSNQGHSFSQRLATASSRALEAYMRVRRYAERLGEELEDSAPSHGIPTTELDPEDSMVVSVGRAIAVTSSMAAISEEMTATITATVPERRPSSTKPGMGLPPNKTPTPNGPRPNPKLEK